MTVYIKTSKHEKMHFPIVLWIPNCICYSRVTARVSSWALRYTDMHLGKAELEALFSALRICRKRHKKLILVDVISHDGTRVKVML